MRPRLIAVLWLTIHILYGCASTEVGFLRELPADDLLVQLAQADFSQEDAVYILNELSYKIEPANIVVRGYSLRGNATTYTRVKIVSILSEKGVKDFGTFEYEYSEYWEDLSCGFKAMARVLKPDGSVQVMPDENLEIIDAVVEDDVVLRKKAIFKIPNLAVGDILQVETVFTRPFSSSSGKIFYLNEDHLTLFSNLYITLPEYYETEYFLVPQAEMPEPKVEQLSAEFGTGKTYFWALQNVPKIHGEPYSTPLRSRSKQVIFNVTSRGEHGFKTGWEKKAEGFFDLLKGEYSLGRSDYEKFDLSGYRNISDLSWPDIDTLYTKIKSRFIAKPYNHLYPEFSSFTTLTQRSHATASDMSMLMYSVLKDAKEDVEYALLRDKRKGSMDTRVSSLMWFDRFGVVVKKDGEEKLYDFERSVPADYEFPWFLDGVQTLMIRKGGFSMEKIQANLDEKPQHLLREKQVLDLSSDNENYLVDLTIDREGVFANEFRSDYFANTAEETTEDLKESFQETSFENVNALAINDFMLEKSVNIQVSGTGSSEKFIEEDFISLSFRNHSLREFLDVFKTQTRHNHLDLDVPRKMDFQYSIVIPEGYELSKPLEYDKLNYRGTLIAKPSVIKQGNALDIRWEIDLRRPLVRQPQFDEYLEKLASIMEDMERPIVFSLK